LPRGVSGRELGCAPVCSRGGGATDGGVGDPEWWASGGPGRRGYTTGKAKRVWRSREIGGYASWEAAPVWAGAHSWSGREVMSRKITVV
jgi:hypothetical protein